MQETLKWSEMVHAFPDFMYVTTRHLILVNQRVHVSRTTARGILKWFHSFLEFTSESSSTLLIILRYLSRYRVVRVNTCFIHLELLYLTAVFLFTIFFFERVFYILYLLPEF